VRCILRRVSDVEWWNVGVTAAGVLVSAGFAWDARRQARLARQDADEALAVQLRDEQRRTVDAWVQGEADEVLAAAKAGWRRKWDECWSRARDIDRASLDQHKFKATQRLREGLIVKRDNPARP
jgi:hypothetical protein